MGLFEDIFSMKSAEQKEREQREFDARMVPLGQAQQDAARDVLAKVLSKRLYDTERMFTFLTAKDKYLDGGRAAAEKYLEKEKRLTPQDRAVFLAFVKLEAGITCMEEYPTEEEILREIEGG